jgi:hypothetical protein
MPHVRKNYLFLKTCLRKRAFATAEDALTTRHHVYQCPACGKWHRTSRKEFKEEREKQAKTLKEGIKKRKCQRKEQSRNKGFQMEQIMDRLRECSAAVIFTRNTSVPRHERNILKAIDTLDVPFVHIAMGNHDEAVRTLREFRKEHTDEFLGILSIRLSDRPYELDKELHQWAAKVVKESGSKQPRQVK